MKTQLTKTQIKSLASTDELKPALCGALYEPEKERLTVTNGHALISYPVIKDDEDGGGVLPVDIFPTVKEAKNPTNRYNINGTAKRTCGPITQEQKLIDEKYPDYEAVLPNGDIVFDICFDLELLKKVAQAVPATNDGMKTVKLTFYGKKSGGIKPVRFETTKHENKITGVIMPVREHL